MYCVRDPKLGQENPVLNKDLAAPTEGLLSKSILNLTNHLNK